MIMNRKAIVNFKFSSQHISITGFLLLFIFISPTLANSNSLFSKKLKMWETVEWPVNNSIWSGNPFDIIAKVRFVHTSTDEVHETKMFYAGNNLWKFRFTATRQGEWTFTTYSDQVNLDNLQGSIIVEENDNKTVRGFLTHKGNQYAIWTGNTPRLEAFRFMVYMNEIKYQNFDNKLRNKKWVESPFLQFKDNTRVHSYLDDASENGFDIIYLHPGYPHVWTDGTNPRLETFDILENIIRTAHTRGMRCHIWMWGDDERGATPKGFEQQFNVIRILNKFLPARFRIENNAINREVDRRLQKYIAARLGPLPGWSMGYGFDLHEWTNAKQLNEWASFLHSEFGWDHLLSARGYTLDGKNNINSYDGFGRNVPLKTSNFGPKGYHEIVENLDSDITRPHLYEERHSYKRENFKLDIDGTVRLIWQEMMAGGMGGWFGFYPFSQYPYPDKEKLRCAQEFWRKYLTLDMVRDHAITDGYALKSSNNRLYIIYKEDSNSVKIDLSMIREPSQIFYVDTLKAYREVTIDASQFENNIITMPYHSDWTIVFRTDNN